MGSVVRELGTAENEYPSPVQFSCALIVQTLVVPRLNFCLRLQCLGSFPVFARPPTHGPADPLRAPALSFTF